jgi:hypothetical protein
MDYYQKYIKYKTKYLELKKLIGGDPRKEVVNCNANDNNKKACNKVAGCVYKKDGICKQKHCLNRSTIGCRNIAGCQLGLSTINNNDLICVTQCEKYTNPENCSNVNECKWNDNKCTTEVKTLGVQV